MLKTWTIAAAAAGLALAGCASDGKKDSADANASNSGLSTSGASSAPPAQPIERAPVEQIDISTKVVYFEFDSSAIKARDLATISNHAKYLGKNPSTSIRLEGHADERGTREYNVGLGERRANAVRDALLLRGVSARQISVVSYGEERPVALGHSESDWDKNRRVEFVY